MDTSLGDLTEFVRQMGILGLLVLFVFGLLREWWVLGREHNDVKSERDAWRQVALTGTRAANEALTIAERKQFEDK